MKSRIPRLAGAVLSAALLFQSLPLTVLAEVKGALSPTVDEAYYATVDYYGNLTRGSVVKTWSLNGASEFTDYGDYDQIKNLTDRTEPEVANGSATFRFGESAPSLFYFEGETEKPFYELPWTISVSYRLNGVPAKAEDLAGQKGVVEITVSAKPNPAAPTYARNNYILTCASTFNMHDYLSVEAPDAQIQTVGSLKAAAFLWLPGEEETYTLRLGSDSFKLNGLTFFMGPLNSGRLSRITDLKEMRDDIHDAWTDLNAAADEVLDSVDSMRTGLNQAADGLEQLNEARAHARNHRSEFYGDLDSFIVELDALSASLAPMSGHLSAANNSVTDLRQNLSDLNLTLLSTRQDLEDAASTLRRLKKDMSDTQDVTADLDRQTHHVRNDIDSLQDLNRSGRATLTTNIRGTLSKMQQLYQGYSAFMKSRGLEPLDALGDGPVINDLATGSDAVRAIRRGNGSLLNLELVDYPETSFQAFAIEKLQEMGYDEEETAYAISLWNYRNDVQKAEAQSSQAYNRVDELLTDLLDVDLASLADLVNQVAEDAGRGFETGASLTAKLDTAIGQLDQLHTTIDNYIPELQATITDLTETTERLKGSLGTLASFLRTTRNIMWENSDRLNRGTEETLTGTADILRKSSGAIDSTDRIRAAKDSIKNLVDDKWDEYTGEDNNLFLMDADAPPQSLTSEKNRSVTSVSVLIRTQEIEEKKSSDDSALRTGTEPEKKSVFGRIGEMFLGLLSFFTGGKH